MTRELIVLQERGIGLRRMELMVKIMTNGLVGQGYKEAAGEALSGRWGGQGMKMRGT